MLVSRISSYELNKQQINQTNEKTTLSQKKIEKTTMQRSKFHTKITNKHGRDGRSERDRRVEGLQKGVVGMNNCL